MSEEREEKSFGELDTLRDGGVESVSEGAKSFGDRKTLRDEGGGILEEWGGKRWKPGEEILGRYVVERELGQGGMGVVYGCFDKVGGVKVAVKALPPELSHNSVEMEEVRENFELVYGLSHPNIASVKTLERDGKGEYFLVMEVAEGESLRRWMRRKGKSEEAGAGRGIPLAEAIPILRQVADALDYAHSKRVVHRDVKPGNVVIDASGEVKVLDFGLAAQIRTSLSRTSQANRGTSGTGPYMAPEQWKAQPQDGAADQYALGVMAYEMLAGRLPFENGEVSVLKEAVLNDEVPAIPELPAYAMRALRKALAKRKEGRFGSCVAFVAALEGECGKRHARGKTIAGWMAVLALLGTGAWWMSGEGKKAGGLPAFLPKTAGETPPLPIEPRDVAFPAEAGDEAARPAPEREEKGKQAQDALEEEAYRLAAAAKMKAGKLSEEGGDWGRGFGERLDEMQTKVRQGEAALQGRNFKKAKAWFEESMALAGWLEENAAPRETAGLAKEAAEEAKKRAEAMDGERLGTTAWRQGEAAMAKAETAWEAAEFRAAEEGWNEAGTAYGESEKAARARKVEQGLEAAREAKRRGDWEECQLAAAGVLGLEDGNAEAKDLNSEAEMKLAARPEDSFHPTKTIPLSEGATMEMVWCPPGEFMMGEKGSRHQVTLTKGFWLAKHEVTQKQWKSVMGSNPSRNKGDDLPVENVSWNDCQEFCKKTGLRLPTEAEWEYACRAGTTTEYFWGDALNGDKANCNGEAPYPIATEPKGRYLKKTARVGSYPANPWGLHDMHGNVWEWCADWYGDYPSSAVTDPTGPGSGSRRVYRGGGCHGNAGSCRSANRWHNSPDYRLNNLGFRPVSDDP